jgi:hypothetical protein
LVLAVVSLFATYGVFRSKKYASQRQFDILQESSGQGVVFYYDYQYLDSKPFFSENGWLCSVLGRDFLFRVKGCDVSKTQAIQYIVKLPDIENVTLYNVEIDEKFVRDLHALPKLTSLRIFCDDFGKDAAVVAPLKDLSSLNELVIDEFNSTAEGMQRISEIPHLGKLELPMACISAGGYGYLENLTQLVALNLEFSDICDADLDFVRHLDHLSELNLRWTSIGDAGVKHLEALTNLSTLNLQGTEISEDAIRSISHLTQLKYLNVSDTKISDKCAENLSALTNLRELHIRRTLISSREADNIQSRLKQGTIYYLNSFEESKRPIEEGGYVSPANCNHLPDEEGSPARREKRD